MNILEASEGDRKVALVSTCIIPDTYRDDADIVFATTCKRSFYQHIAYLR